MFLLIISDITIKHIFLLGIRDQNVVELKEEHPAQCSERAACIAFFVVVYFISQLLWPRPIGTQKITETLNFRG